MPRARNLCNVILMSSNEDKTAFHGCHCPGAMAVRMRKLLAIPLVCFSAEIGIVQKGPVVKRIPLLIRNF